MYAYILCVSLVGIHRTNDQLLTDVSLHLEASKEFLLHYLTVEGENDDCNQAKFFLPFSMFLLVKDIIVNLNNNQIIKTIRFIEFPELLRTFEIIYIIRRSHFYRFIMSGVHY